MTLRIIAGKYKGHLLKSPKGSSTRPTQGMLREAVFNICQNEIEGARFLDLYAGSGAMGFEALSRGASHATLVESDRHAISCIKENIALLNVEEFISLIPFDAHRALQRLFSPFGIVYIDPPYGAPTVPLLQELLARSLLSPGSLIFIEERHDPKNNSLPFDAPQLRLKDSRRFGTALLHQYRFSTA